MLQLVARYADAWNWWGSDETLEQLNQRLRPIVELLEQACEAEDRDPATVGRTFDLYTVVPEGFSTQDGTVEGLDLLPKTSAAVEAMQSVVEIVHKSCVDLSWQYNTPHVTGYYRARTGS